MFAEFSRTMKLPSLWQLVIWIMFFTRFLLDRLREPRLLRLRIVPQIVLPVPIALGEFFALGDGERLIWIKRIANMFWCCDLFVPPHNTLSLL